MSAVQLGQYPPASHLIAHISDTHFLGGGQALYGAVDTDTTVYQAMAQLERSGLRPDALLFTGDIADRGEVDAYRRVRDIVEAAAERMGAPVIWVMGNHDKREAFRTELLREAGSTAPVDRVFDIGGVRIIALDTSVPGYHHGDLSDAQLAWLSDVLREPAPHGSLLAMHHPPVPTMLPLMAILELRGQARLAEVVADSDIRAILGGHLHYATTGLFAGIPVSVAAATCYTLDLGADASRLLSGVDGGQSFDVVHVYDDQVVASTIPLESFPEITGFSVDYLPMIEAMPADARLEQLSSKTSHLNLNEAAASDV